MQFRDDTIAELKKLYRDYGLSNQNNDIQKFSEDLNYVLSKLANMIVSELELERSGQSDAKILKFLELAALASKIMNK